jgi:hypothetical protein
MIVNAIPTAPSITKGEGQLTFCAPGSVILISDLENGIKWYQNSQSIDNETGAVYTATTGGDYTATRTLNGCESLESNVITVTVNTVPTVAAITGNGAVTVEGTTELADATAGGVWSSENSGIASVSTNGIVTGVLEGTTTIHYTVTNTCGATTVDKVVIVSEAARLITAPVNPKSQRVLLTGVSLDITAVPNPTPDYFTLTVKGNIGSNVSLRVTDLFGSVVERHEKIAPGTVLRLGQTWRGGTYFVEVIQGDQRKVIKIIKAN